MKKMLSLCLALVLMLCAIPALAEEKVPVGVWLNGGYPLFGIYIIKENNKGLYCLVDVDDSGNKVFSGAFPATWKKTGNTVYFSIEGGTMDFGDFIFNMDPATHQLVINNRGLKFGNKELFRIR